MNIIKKSLFSLTVVGWAGLIFAAEVSKVTGFLFLPDSSTILDSRTNLRWQRCSMGLHWDVRRQCVGKLKRFTFSQAKSLNAKLADEGVWRVPSRAELESLVDKNQLKFTIDRKAFPDVNLENAFFWTTDVEKETSSPWAVDFHYGNVSYYFGDYAIDGNKWSVRLVRSEKPQ